MITANDIDNVTGLIEATTPIFILARANFATLTDEGRLKLAKAAHAHATAVRGLTVHIEEFYEQQCADVRDMVGENAYFATHPAVRFFAACEELAEALEAWDADEHTDTEDDRAKLLEKVRASGVEYLRDAAEIDATTEGDDVDPFEVKHALRALHP